ncbi:MAG TPA: trimethylamine methyltransferase family protein [Anaerolineales bacterium]|nr:trimethylamine methyltransferase family protein [Anaerolineales bacterium]
MRLVGGPYPLLKGSEISTIHAGALHILAEMGMEIQNERLLTACERAGFNVDHTTQRVRFPAPIVENFIAGAGKFDWDNFIPTVSSTAGVYHGRYHDPATGNLLDWSEERLAGYFALARALPNVGTCSVLGSRLPVPALLEPLYERYFCWKYGASEGGSIALDEVCPYLLDLYQMYADHQGKSLAEVFVGNVYLIPALKLGRHEAWQVVYFWERGLRVRIGDMLAMGATAPVTAAGAVTLNLAERLALALLNFALWGERKLHLHCGLFPFDMRTMIFPFGRPEGIAPMLITAQLARYYGVSFSGHGGLTTAKLPSPEAGYQKALTAVPILLAGGNLWLDAGLLSCDEVYSPIQMVLDNEFLGALKHLCHDIEISDDTLALDTILAVGPGGHYLDQIHTAKHFRRAQWQPQLWTRTMLGPWLEAGGKIDTDVAREHALSLMPKNLPEGLISSALEKDVLSLLERARQSLMLHNA